MKLSNRKENDMGILLSVDYTHSIMVIGVILAISILVGIFIYWLSNVTTGGRGVLYKFIQDYGYDDARTHDALEKCIAKIMIGEGYGNGTNLSFFHEVGNTFIGTFQCDGIQHEFVLRTDGWHFEYQLDNGILKQWKP